MEGTVRVFAGEFNRSTLTIQKSDREGPRFVVTPGGAWCNLIYLSGALTEISENGDMLRLRISDPTGVFDVVIGGIQTDLSSMARKIPVPSFLTIVGKAQMYQRQGSYTLSVRPESVQIADRSVRDIWVLRTADMTLDRLERLVAAMRGETNDPPNQRVVEHYRLTPKKVQELVGMVESALSTIQVSGAPAQSPPHPDELILSIIKEHQGIRGITIEEVITLAVLEGVLTDTVQEVIRDLIRRDECYQPQKGIIKLL
jgi:RPA family protein